MARRTRRTHPTPKADLTFLDLAGLILAKTKKTMTYGEIWDYATARNLDLLVGSRGKTPSATLSAGLGVDIRENPHTRFALTNTRPRKYYLRPSVHRGTGEKYGPPLSFRGLQHEPLDEQGVVFLFGLVARELGFLVEAVRKRFPDCLAKRRVDPSEKSWIPVRIEFEMKSSNFRGHRHEPSGCDLIVCWMNDWQESPVEVLELRTEIKRLNRKAAPPSP